MTMRGEGIAEAGEAARGSGWQANRASPVMSAARSGKQPDASQ